MERNDLDSADGRLTAFVDEILGVAAARAGSYLACRPGCSECCIGPFPITALDAVRLRRGLAELFSRDAARAAAIRARAKAAAACLASDFPGDPASGELWAGDASHESFFRRHETLPCPVLDPETGRCDLYEFRPVSCRTFGPPVRIEGVPLPPCRLCFTGATRRQIESCRVDVDCSQIEDPILDRLRSETGLSGETLVAFALSGAASRPAVTPVPAHAVPPQVG
jgi:Fe-S-cluster containining protein